MNCRFFCQLTSILLLIIFPLLRCKAQEPAWGIDSGLTAYFQTEIESIASQNLSGIRTLEDWDSKRERYRAELLEMLGLQPLPQRTPLEAEITGTTEHEEFLVEKLHFQSRPGLYVTANLYRPKEQAGPLPAILYVCGHGRVKQDGVSYGNKTHYQHHGEWFARNGYVCLTIDTLQLGEIEGVHHGTHRFNRWWWLNRGYTPAGVEAWNCVRALDYLQSREEVDGDRIGVTGRSGGGAYSWWIAAIDDRIKCAVPVAGITDLQNHVVDGCVEGHCDCMFMVNTYRWDYSKVAALVAPRPLLISNTDTDRIFPLDGVYRIYNDVRRIYQLNKAGPNVALHITAGGHKDTQELRVHAFRWLNKHLRGDDELIRMPAEKLLDVTELKVFEESPSDEENTTIDESFTRKVDGKSMEGVEAGFRGRLAERLLEKCFRGWPRADAPPKMSLASEATVDGVTLQAFDFESQPHVPLRLYIAKRANLKNADLVVLNVLDHEDWRDFAKLYHSRFPGAIADSTARADSIEPDEEGFEQTRKMFQSFAWAMAYVAPRGIGPTAWGVNEKKEIQLKRRYYLVGQSLDGMRVYDTRRALQGLRSLPGWESTQTWLQGERQMSGIALYASLFEPNLYRVELHELPRDHREGPFFLNLSRVTTVQRAVAAATESSKVVLYDEIDPWSTAVTLSKRLGTEGQLQIRPPLATVAD
ncbi:MAG: prolyl oligopeptidase family serine peptidase [Planctomycetota bacterium]